MAVILKDFAGPNGITDNMGGLLGYWFLGFVGEMTNIPFVTDPDTALTHKETVTVTDDITFAVGKGFAKMYTTKDTGKVTHASVGDIDGRATQSTAEFFIPGDNNDMFGILKQAKNNRLIVLAPRPNGKIYMVGTARFPADLEYSYDSATNGGGKAGTTIKVMTFEITPILYEGEITLIP